MRRLTALPIELVQLEPMLLDRRRCEPFSHPEWLFEVKYDGHRMLAQFGGGQAFLKSRGGLNYSDYFPEVVESLQALELAGRFVVDGEVCVLDDLGRSDFDRLQSRAARQRLYPGCDLVTYCIFDVLMFEGRRVMDLPLTERKQLLRAMFWPKPKRTLLVVDSIEAEGLQLYAMAVQLKLEGLVAKLARSVYAPGERTTYWRRLKRPGAVPPGRFAHRRRKSDIGSE